MTAAQVLENAPDIKALDSAISIRALQLALLQQQYAPNDPLLAGRPLTETPTADLSGLEGLNVGVSDFGSDKVTIGDATSVSQIYPQNNIRCKEAYPFHLLQHQCHVPRLGLLQPEPETTKSDK